LHNDIIVQDCLIEGDQVVGVSFALLSSAQPLVTHAGYVNRRGWDFPVSLFVCLFVCPQHNSKTNDPKVFKLGVENDLGIP